MRRGVLLLTLALALAGPAVAAAPSDWRPLITVRDRQRLRDWRGAWVKALAEARAGGDAAAIAAEPALFAFDEALTDHVVPAAGDYRCRHIAVGARLGGPALTIGPWERCAIEKDGAPVHFTDVDAGERYPGLIYADTDRRAIFLGTTMLGDERRAATYGHAAGRDVVGVVERIGERRWRLVLPYPRFGAALALVELVPAG